MIKCYMVYWVVTDDKGRVYIRTASGNYHLIKQSAEDELKELSDDPRYAGERFVVLEVML